MSTNKQALREQVIIDISKHPIIKQAYEVCQAIEKCGASLEITDAVTKASALMQGIASAMARLDELEAAERQNGYLREQSAEWERKAISNFEDCSELAKRIEDLESQRQMAFMTSNRWADKFREAQKCITELTGKPAEEYADDDELLFEIDFCDDLSTSIQTAQWLKELRIRRAAGITVKGGSE